MKDLLMNPWTITIIGGLVVGVVVFLVTRKLARRGEVPPPNSANSHSRKHRIEVGKDGHIESGGIVRAGDKGTPAGEGQTGRQHDIQVRAKGTIIAQGDVVAGDTRDAESARE